MVIQEVRRRDNVERREGEVGSDINLEVKSTRQAEQSNPAYSLILRTYYGRSAGSHQKALVLSTFFNIG